jgi:hypothetical protein
VPNWNGMTMPDTTPSPNDTAKILVQNTETRKIGAVLGLQIEGLEHGDVAGEPDREGGKEDVEYDNPRKLKSLQDHRIKAHGAIPIDGPWLRDSRARRCL